MSGAKKTIGIIGGAGPMAGLLLGQKIVETCQREYGCVRDFDFPKLILYSFPFGEMLEGNINSDKVSKQLKHALEFLEGCGAECMAIACNTLHAFIDPSWKFSMLVNVIGETRYKMESDSLSTTLVLCTTTTRDSGMYDSSNVEYPSDEEQCQIDRIVINVLGGDIRSEDSLRLASLINSKNGQRCDSVLLGCSELSILNRTYPLDGSLGKIIDPIDIVSKKLCQYSFIPNQPQEKEKNNECNRV